MFCAPTAHGSSAVRDGLELVCRFCAGTRFSQCPEVGSPEHFDERPLVRIDPRSGWETTSGPVYPPRFAFLEDEGDDAGEKALHEVENVVDRRAYLPHGLENVTMEHHLPLYTALGREKRTSVDGKL